MPVHRYVGPCLVNAPFDDLRDCVTHGRYPVLKVVPTRSYGLGKWVFRDSRRHWEHVPWDDANRLAVCNLTRWTIVRTETGDHSTIDPSRVAEELRPWYRAKKDSIHRINYPRPDWSNLLIELGNEPNLVPPLNPADPPTLRPAREEERRQLLRAIDVVHQLDREFDAFAKIICPGLAPVSNVDAWLQLFTSPDPGWGNRNLRQDCHFFGVHFYGVTNWMDDPSMGNDMRDVVDKYNRWVADRPWWILTEFGLRSGRANSHVCDDFTKGKRNAKMLHFGESIRPLPPYVWGGTYYALDQLVDNRPSDKIGGYSYYYPNGDWSYRHTLDNPDQ